MTDNRDEKLDRLLRSRGIEAASPDLAQRVILKSQQLPQSKSLPLWQWLRDLFAEFHLPKPAYVLASALVLGMVIGFTAPQQTGQGADENGAIIQTFLSGDEALL
jgi:hypothetical protein